MLAREKKKKKILKKITQNPTKCIFGINIIVFFKFPPEEYYIKITAQRNVCINFWLAMSEKIPDLTVPLKAHHKQGDYTLSWCSSLLGTPLLFWFFPEERL